MKDESQQPIYFCPKCGRTNPNGCVFTECSFSIPIPSDLLPPPSLDRSVSQPGKQEGEILNQWISKHGRDLRFINSDLWQKSHDALKANGRETTRGFQNNPDPQPSQLGDGHNVRKEIDWHNANFKIVDELNEQLATLRAESLIKDTRIKELEKFVEFAEFVVICEDIDYGLVEKGKQLLEEYKKQLK